MRLNPARRAFFKSNNPPWAKAFRLGPEPDFLAGRYAGVRMFRIPPKSAALKSPKKNRSPAVIAAFGPSSNNMDPVRSLARDKVKSPVDLGGATSYGMESNFRQVIVITGQPDVFYTEFISADGLCSEKGRPRLLPYLKFEENERPIVAQFFGSRPENFYECAGLAVELGFDGIDINMGCPAGKVVKHDSGAGLIRNPELATEIIRETKRGAEGLPVSVKTRIGYNKIITEEWVSHLIEAEPTAITLHGRTMKEMSKFPAHWDEIGKAAVLCRKAGIPIIGNGDVASYDDGIEKAEQYGLDGIMVGRGEFSNPWFFDPSIDPATKTSTEKIELLKQHIELFTELWGNSSTDSGQVKNFDTMKKFFKVYISDWDGAKELRTELMKTKNENDVMKVLNFLK